MQWLLKHGADVNYQQAKYRMTALHIAARRASTPVCQLLLAHKADVSIRERNGLTAGELVTSTRCLAVRKLAPDVQLALGVDLWAGAYRDTSQDPENVAFWCASIVVSCCVCVNVRCSGAKLGRRRR